MNKLLLLLILGVNALPSLGQTQQTGIAQGTMPFGKIEKADLEMTSCDFEKDANAEILFDQAKIGFVDYAIVMERHTRIKIFNENGKNEASIRIAYFGARQFEAISNLEAETINLENGKQVITKVDKKLFYTQPIVGDLSFIAFAFPDVKPGSVIEYKYQLTSKDILFFPTWYFQGYLPIRYSELSTSMINEINYQRLTKVYQPYARMVGSIVDDDQVRALANVPSLPNEPYSGSRKESLERVEFQLTAAGSPGKGKMALHLSWPKVSYIALSDNGFGGQFSRGLAGEDSLVQKVRALKSEADKIAFIFNEVKKRMSWNDIDANSSPEGTVKAWNAKTGNSTEINLIVYHLLKKAGVKAWPMTVSTKDYGAVNPAYPSLHQFNKTVVYVAVDSTKAYVLDATDKYNLFNEAPSGLLNSYGLRIDADSAKSQLVFIQKASPVMQSVSTNAEIKPDGKMNGTAEITSYSYNRINSVRSYKVNGEKKYIDSLSNNNNNLKISDLKFENMEVDTLPLTQHYSFTLLLAGSDENYIYFNPNLLTGTGKNPFLSEVRKTNIDFGYRNNYLINGIYKLPDGYKIDAMPHSINMVMPDTSISFRRTIAEQDGIITVRCVINYKKSQYSKDDYPEIFEFYRKMYEMLNEQIVLKKL